MTNGYNGFGDARFAADDYSLMTFIARMVAGAMATATLVRVVSVSGNIVNVQPMVSQIDGAGTATPHGTIHGLPWFALRGGPCAVIIPPVVGDIGMAVFCHSDISSVVATGAPAAPPTRRKFDWADGLYLGGFLPASAPTTLITVDGSGNVLITAPSVQITGDLKVTGTVTADTDVVGATKSLKSHTHGGVTTGSGTSGPPS